MPSLLYFWTADSCVPLMRDLIKETSGGPRLSKTIRVIIAFCLHAGQQSGSKPRCWVHSCFQSFFWSIFWYVLSSCRWMRATEWVGEDEQGVVGGETFFFILSMYAVGLSSTVGLNVVKTHYPIPIVPLNIGIGSEADFGEFYLKSKQGRDLPMGTFVRFSRWRSVVTEVSWSLMQEFQLSVFKPGYIRIYPGWNG